MDTAAQSCQPGHHLRTADYDAAAASVYLSYFVPFLEDLLGAQRNPTRLQRDERLVRLRSLLPFVSVNRMPHLTRLLEEMVGQPQQPLLCQQQLQQ